MICTRCATAADQRLPRGHHCDTAGGPGAACDCQHLVDRYRPAPLTVINATPPLRVTACDAGRHRAHPGETCGDYETERAVAHAAWESMFASALYDAGVEAAKQMTDQMLYGPAGRPVPIHAGDAPAALRGPAARTPSGDPEPLRRLAAEALGAEPTGQPLDGRAAVAAFYDHLDRVTEEMRARTEQYRRELPDRAARIADHLTALLPDEVRAAGLYLACEPASLPPMIRLLADGEDPDDTPTVVPAHVLAVYERQGAENDAHTSAVEAAITRMERAHGPDDIIRIPHATTED